ncbi:exonuclease domain-containing protein [Candidatus Parabeggiatoa sp. HSG14]|uniref:exonuclease domain-containing protein n=1 Tax=Candidatus Parabeggiatoa sp. HSG14 TaxID=3055593 RepID=UPI0032E530EB
MVNFNIATVMTANFSTTHEAEKLSDEMESRLGFKYHYQLARLAMGRSLGGVQFSEEIPHSKSSKSIAGTQLFGQQQELLWIGLIIAYFKFYGNEKTEIDLTVFQDQVRKHWHRGIILLNEDWLEAKENYEQFIHILTTRYAIKILSPQENQSKDFFLPNDSSRTKIILPAARNVWDRKPVFLDTETTGLYNTDEVIEIAVIDYDGTIIIDTLIKPTIKIPYQATQVHGISNEMVEFKPSFTDIWYTLSKILENRPIVGHNLSFDLRLIKQTAAKYRLFLKKEPQENCTLKMYKVFQKMANLQGESKLEEATKKCGISFTNAHRAAADTEVTRQLLMYMAGVRS